MQYLRISRTRIFKISHRLRYWPVDQKRIGWNQEYIFIDISKSSQKRNNYSIRRATQIHRNHFHFGCGWNPGHFSWIFIFCHLRIFCHYWRAFAKDQSKKIGRFVEKNARFLNKSQSFPRILTQLEIRSQQEMALGVFLEQIIHNDCEALSRNTCS